MGLHIVFHTQNVECILSWLLSCYDMKSFIIHDSVSLSVECEWEKAAITQIYS